MKKITPHLWFDKEAKQAAELYVSAIPDSAVTDVTTLKDTPSGDCDIVSFQLFGQPFQAISAGPYFRFNPSISFHLKCNSAEEVDALWARLSEGGEALMPLGSYPFAERYGWVQDRYGVSWQPIYTGPVGAGQRVTPVLMFVGPVCGRGEEAINFYVSVFQNAPGSRGRGNSQATVLSRYGAGEGPNTEGTLRYAQFTLGGQEFGAIDSALGHDFGFNEAISLIVPCDTQEEIDYLWEKLSAEPEAEQCGWLKDKFGVSWQITPAAMKEMLGGGDSARTRRVTEAFLKMKKFDIAELRRAAAG